MEAEYYDCLYLFNELKSLDQTTTLHPNWDDERGRLQLFAGHTFLSLDDKFRDASPYVRDEIQDLLGDLRSILDICCDGLHSQYRALPLNTTNSCESIHEVSEYYLDVVDIIDGLFSLQSAVQYPAQHDVREDQVVSIQDFTVEDHIELAKSRFPKGDSELIRRLGEANALNQRDWPYAGEERPYICTFGGCIDERTRFSSREAWSKHENDAHRSHWICANEECSHTFTSIADFESHMMSCHGSTFGRRQLPMLGKMCKRACPSDSWLKCPLCDTELGGSEMLLRHMAEELEQYTLFARRHAEDRVAKAAIDGSVARSSNLTKSTARFESLMRFPPKARGWIKGNGPLVYPAANTNIAPAPRERGFVSAIPSLAQTSPFAQTTNDQRRLRSRSDMLKPEGLAALTTQHGGPPVPTLATRPSAAEESMHFQPCRQSDVNDHIGAPEDDGVAEPRQSFNQEQPFRCTVAECPSQYIAFTSKNDLERHNWFVHGILPSGYTLGYKCADPGCKYEHQIFTHCDQYKEHVKHMHMNASNYENYLNGIYLNEIVKRSEQIITSSETWEADYFKGMPDERGPAGSEEQAHDSERNSMAKLSSPAQRLPEHPYHRNALSLYSPLEWGGFDFPSFEQDVELDSESDQLARGPIDTAMSRVVDNQSRYDGGFYPSPKLDGLENLFYPNLD